MSEFNETWGKPSPSTELLAELQNELDRVSTAYIQCQFIMAYISAHGEQAGWLRVRQVIDMTLLGVDLNNVLREAAAMMPANAQIERLARSDNTLRSDVGPSESEKGKL